MHTSIVIIAGMCVISICLTAQAVSATDHRDGPIISIPPGNAAPAPAGNNPQPGYNPYVTVDYVDGGSSDAKQKASLGSLQSLRSVREIELFANSRGGDQGVGSMGLARMGDGSVRPQSGSASPPAATPAQPFQATTGAAATAPHNATPKLFEHAVTGKHFYQPQPTPSLAAPTGPATKPTTTPQVNTFSSTAPVQGKAGSAAAIPNASFKRN